jgi:hypothetical protein
MLILLLFNVVFSICILLVYVHVLLFFLKQTCSIILCLLWFVLDFIKLYLFINC